ncbi:hypothetical protein ARMSODRAFT_978303 [Armillaria solidipes]|uniref:Uncharacterized protein n=1 Tax=Armillaria solidipes TaxID=1076256 RepID=A0A2H3B3S6_9AGAR|nr:hypothetical protein ARMSODRAFT_978303 [Armillaria solidipes]
MDSALYGPGIAVELLFPALVALDTQSGVFEEFGREMTGMSPVGRYKDAEGNCIRQRNFLRGLRARQEEGNERYKTGTGTGHENETRKKRLSEAEKTKEKEAHDELHQKVEED